MTEKTKKGLLFTPGPLTTSLEVKKVMLEDWGSRDIVFLETTKRIRDAVEKIGGITGKNPSHTCIPIQGSGTFAVEAAITSLIPRDGRILVLVNGAYGHRICEICRYHSRSFEVYETKEHSIPDAAVVEKYLKNDKEITDVVLVHCETTSGILNPVREISKVVEKSGRRLLVDAMSSFGALPLEINNTPYSSLVTSSNKCLEGVPGLGLVLVEKALLETSKGVADSLSLDLYAQWYNFERTGQWRFTPPTHVVVALDQALHEHKIEGGVSGRYKRYLNNHRVLLDGMESLGFDAFLPENLQAPIIVTVHSTKHANYSFKRFYQLLKRRGFTIYPGKLTKIDSFRIGCIGDISEPDIRALISAVEEVLFEMKVRI